MEKDKEGENPSHEETTKYCKVVVKVLKMIIWTRPKFYNAVSDLSHHMSAATKKKNHILIVMVYRVVIYYQVRKVKPNRQWDGMEK